MFSFLKKKPKQESETPADIPKKLPAIPQEARFFVMAEQYLPKDADNGKRRLAGVLIIAAGVIVLSVGIFLIFRYLIQTPSLEIEPAAVDGSSVPSASPVEPAAQEPADRLEPSAPRTMRAEVRDAHELEISTGRLIVPAEAMAELNRVELQGEAIFEPETETREGLLIAGRYKIIPSDTKFQREVRLVIDYSSLVTSVFKEEDLKGMVFAGGVWAQDPGARVDLGTKTVTFIIQGAPAEAYGVLVLRPKENASEDTGASETPTVERPPSGPDTDGDGLSDEEEVIYGTDPRRPDTDFDGFLDGLEVVNFYSPRAGDDAVLETSGLVQKFNNEKINYSLLYPARFLTRYLDESQRELLISTATGEFFEVLVQDNPEQLITREWVQRQFPDFEVTSLRSSTIEDVFAIWSPDNLSVYAARGPQVYIISYSPGSIQRLNFTTTFEMLVKSLRFAVVSPASAAPTD